MCCVVVADLCPLSLWQNVNAHALRTSEEPFVRKSWDAHAVTTSKLTNSFRSLRKFIPKRNKRKNHYLAAASCAKYKTNIRHSVVCAALHRAWCEARIFSWIVSLRTKKEKKTKMLDCQRWRDAQQLSFILFSFFVEFVTFDARGRITRFTSTEESKRLPLSVRAIVSNPKSCCQH